MKDSTIAYYEAGHAVAAFWLHRPIHKVTIMGDENSSGKVVRKRRPNTINPRKWFNETGYRIQADIIILYAGQLAQERFAPRSLRPGDMSWQGRGDDDQMVDLALAITDSDGVSLLLQYLKHEAELLINHFWDDIVTVAKALLKQKTFTGDQLRDVIHQHMTV